VDGYIFSNLAYIQSRYINTENTAILDNQVEHVPELTAKMGVRLKWHKLSLTGQFSHTALQYSDATNAERTPNAVNGIIPAYQLVDVSGGYTYNQYLKIDFGINNLLNEKYFTRRAGGYPGPGIIPSPTRNFYVTASLKF